MENSKDNEIAKSDQNRRIDIGTDELLEILTWLPAKQFVKFSSLSKTIHSLVSTHEFAKTQCIRSSLMPCSGGVFLQEGKFESFDSSKLEFHALPESSTSIPNESLSYIIQTDCHIVASSKGLLLLHKGGHSDEDFLICNPATRRWAPLAIPPSLKSRLRHWNYQLARPHLECHPRNLDADYRDNNWGDDYTVIFPLLKDRNRGFGLYVYCNGMWEEGTCELAVYCNGKWEEGTCDLATVGEGRLLRADMPVCLFNGWNGGLVLHYLYGSKKWELSVVAYDVGRRAFSRNFKIPDQEGALMINHVLKLVNWRSSSSSSSETIALVKRHNKRFTVWVLEEYESGSWTKVFNKATTEMGVIGDIPITSASSWIVVMSATGMCLVFSTGNRVYVYQLDGPHSGRLQLVVEQGYGYGPIGPALMYYTNTLRPVCARDTHLFTF